MKLRNLFPLVVLCALALGVAACSPSDDSSDTPDDQPAADEDGFQLIDGKLDVDNDGAITDADDCTACISGLGFSDADIEDGLVIRDGATDDGVDAGAASGQGSATITIGDESWTFDDIVCVFSPEESGNPSVSFRATGFGESASGARIQLDATIEDEDEQGGYEGESVKHSLSLNDVEDSENPSLGWSSTVTLSEETIIGSLFKYPFIQVDGKSISAETTMDDQLTEEPFDEVPATLEATCP